MDYEYLYSYRRLVAEYEAIINTSRDRKLVAAAKLQLRLLKKKHKEIEVEACNSQPKMYLW
jgi:hypothetical protein